MIEQSYIQELFAERIGGNKFGKDTAIYKFEKIKRAKNAAVKENPNTPLIDMGVGEPDQMAFDEVINVLCDEAKKTENRGYADNGGDDFKEAAANYMKNVFGVELDAKTQILHSMGSKAALSILPNCFINPNDYVLMSVPGYPVFGTHAKYLGGKVYNMPLLEENDFLPDLDAVPQDVLEKAKVIVINYPNNPTGASATLEFFKKVVAFAKKNNIVVVSDCAYAALIFEGTPLSIFQVEGAQDVAIELHSLSKSYNMTGWRIGFVCGNALMISAYANVKDNSDSGQFLAIQKAAAAGLNNPDITKQIAAKYSRRMDLLVNVLNASGFKVKKPKASFFLYAPCPKTATKDGQTVTFNNAEEFSGWMISKNLISTVPWDDAGSFVRFSVTFNADTIEKEIEIISEIKNRLASCNFEF